MDLNFVDRALDNGLDAVGAVSTDLVVRYWNAPLAQLSGIEPHQALGQPLETIAPRIRASAFEDALNVALSGDSITGEPPFVLAADRVAAHGHEWFLLPISAGGVVQGAAFVARSSVGRAVAVDQMAEAEQRFRSMANHSPVLLWMAGTDTLCTFFNQTWLDFSGRSLDQECGVGWLEGVHAVDLEGCVTRYMASFSNRESFEMEYRLKRHDGVYRWLLDRGSPRYTPGGDFAGYVGSCVDITERKQAEDSARVLAADLGRANEHMETLLYGASHDLNEPVRTVATYAERLEEHLTGKLDEKAARYLHFVRGGAKRMSELIEALLGLARVRQHTLAKADVELDPLVAEILKVYGDLGAAQVQVESLPAVQGDAVLLRSVFANLVSNALKFHREGQPPRVKISSKRQGAQVVIEVADDGVGFDDRFAERAFAMFGRLHAREQFAGSGVGLALAADIVSRHGGKIWAESRPGQGARFFVALEPA